VLSARYLTVPAEMADAFSWKPDGVSSSAAGRSPHRCRISRCGLTIVVAVSPEPMTTTMRCGI
jgi:hypothetical protein